MPDTAGKVLLSMEEILPFDLSFVLDTGRTPDRSHILQDTLAGMRIHSERLVIRRRSGSSYVLGNTQVPDGSADEEAYCRDFIYGLRKALARAIVRRVPSFLFLGPRAVIHPNFRSIASSLRLPDEFEMYIVGCVHSLEPRYLTGRSFVPSEPSHVAGIIVSSSCYYATLKILRASSVERSGSCQDLLMKLWNSLRTYCCQPNLAWTSGAGQRPGNYSSDGFQIADRHVAMNALRALLRLPRAKYPQRPRLALLFLTVADLKNERTWKEFLQQDPDGVRVFSHQKYPDLVTDTLLQQRRIKAYFETEWGDISLVRATRALLLEALSDESITHFALVSDACIPAKPLPEILRHLAFDPRSMMRFRRLSEASPLQQSRARAMSFLPPECIRFQSQWFLFDRITAVFAASVDLTDKFADIEVPDECYFATILALQGFPLDGFFNNSSVTWADWQDRRGRPKEWKSVSPHIVGEIVASGAHFARKFDSGSGMDSYGMHKTTPNYNIKS